MSTENVIAKLARDAAALREGASQRIVVFETLLRELRAAGFSEADQVPIIILLEAAREEYDVLLELYRDLTDGPRFPN